MTENSNLAHAFDSETPQDHETFVDDFSETSENNAVLDDVFKVSECHISFYEELALSMRDHNVAGIALPADLTANQVNNDHLDSDGPNTTDVKNKATTKRYKSI